MPSKSKVCFMVLAHLNFKHSVVTCDYHIGQRRPGDSDLILKAELINWIQHLGGLSLGHAVETKELPRSKNQEIPDKNSVFWFPLTKPGCGNRATFHLVPFSGAESQLPP